jgi:hypothetical protein
MRFPAPRKLTAFPNADVAKPKTKVKGVEGKLRKRWKDNDGQIYESDSQHGTIEIYDRQGNHLGEFDPDTGLKVGEKVNGRKVEP